MNRLLNWLAGKSREYRRMEQKLKTTMRVADNWKLRADQAEAELRGARAKLAGDYVVPPNKCIILTRTERQGGLNRQRFAELLIEELPKDHSGRNTWLLNYGTRAQAMDLRNERGALFDIVTQAATK